MLMVWVQIPVASLNIIMRYTWFSTCCMRNQGRNSCCFQSQPFVTYINYINKWEFIISKVFVFILILFYVGFPSTGSGSLFSSLLLCRIIDIACCIALVLISLKVCLIVFSGILSFSSKIFIEGMCVVALEPAVMTISGFTFHPLLVMLSISG